MTQQLAYNREVFPASPFLPSSTLLRGAGSFSLWTINPSIPSPFLFLSFFFLPAAVFPLVLSVHFFLSYDSEAGFDFSFFLTYCINTKFTFFRWIGDLKWQVCKFRQMEVAMELEGVLVSFENKPALAIEVNENEIAARPPRQNSAASLAISQNITEPMPGQTDWSFDNLPDILYVFSNPVRGQRYNDDVPTKPSVWGGEVRDFDILPDRISSNVEEFRVEAWMRMDRRIQLQDIVERMNPQLRVQRNALQQRGVRFRHAFRLLSWGTGGKTTSLMKEKIKGELQRRGIDLEANTTRGLTPGLINPSLGEAGGRIPVPPQYNRRSVGFNNMQQLEPPLIQQPQPVQPVQQHYQQQQQPQQQQQSPLHLLQDPNILANVLGLLQQFQQLPQAHIQPTAPQHHPTSFQPTRGQHQAGPIPQRRYSGQPQQGSQWPAQGMMQHNQQPRQTLQVPRQQQQQQVRAARRFQPYPAQHSQLQRPAQTTLFRQPGQGAQSVQQKPQFAQAGMQRQLQGVQNFRQAQRPLQFGTCQQQGRVPVAQNISTSQPMLQHRLPVGYQYHNQTLQAGPYQQANTAQVVQSPQQQLQSQGVQYQQPTVSQQPQALPLTTEQELSEELELIEQVLNLPPPKGCESPEEIQAHEKSPQLAQVAQIQSERDVSPHETQPAVDTNEETGTSVEDILDVPDDIFADVVLDDETNSDIKQKNDETNVSGEDTSERDSGSGSDSGFDRDSVYKTNDSDYDDDDDDDEDHDLNENKKDSADEEKLFCANDIGDLDFTAAQDEDCSEVKETEIMVDKVKSEEGETREELEVIYNENKKTYGILSNIQEDDDCKKNLVIPSTPVIVPTTSTLSESRTGSSRISKSVKRKTNRHRFSDGHYRYNNSRIKQTVQQTYESVFGKPWQRNDGLSDYDRMEQSSIYNREHDLDIEYCKKLAQYDFDQSPMVPANREDSSEYPYKWDQEWSMADFL